MNENLVWALYFFGSLFGLVLFYFQFRKKKLQASKFNSSAMSRPIRSIQSAVGVQSDILQEGRGRGAQRNDLLTVEYTAWLTTGEKVDSSYDRGRSLTFTLGKGHVIDGWDKSLEGIQLGEKRRVTVPAKLAYGKKGHSKIPPDATVIFEIELTDLK